MKSLMMASAVAVLLASSGLPSISSARAEEPITAASLSVTRDQLIAKQNAGAQFIDVDGVNVRYKDEGTGPVVLLIHGSFGSLDDWDGWLPALAGYRVIRFDIPGFGISGPIATGNYSVERIDALIDNFMDLLDAEHFTIVGTSYGGPVAFRYAATRTRRVDGLVLMNSAGIEYGGRRGTTTPPPASQNEFLNRTLVDQAYIRKTMAIVINDPAKITPELVQRKVDMANLVGRDQEGKTATLLFEHGTPERVLAHVRAPTLILWGGANKALSTETAYTFAKDVKNACSVKTIVYPTGGHLLHIDQPEPTSKDFRAFLDAHARKSSPRCH